MHGQLPRERMAGAFPIGSPLEGPFRGYQFYATSKSSALPLIWGGSRRWWDLWASLVPGGRTVVHRGSTRGLLYPVLFARHWYEGYDLETSQPLALKSGWGSCLGLVAYGHLVIPREPEPRQEGFPAQRGKRLLLHGKKPIEEVTFEHMRAFTIAYGLLGAAERNGRAYLQLLFFVRIPLWATE